MNNAFAKQSKTVADIPATGPAPVTLAKAVAKGKTKLKLTWNKVSGAERYLVYFTPCSKSANPKMKKIKTLTADKTSYTKTGLKANRLYKAQVVAQAKKNGKWTTLSKSKVIYAATANKKGKYTNAASLKLNKTSVTLEKGKAVKLSGSVKKANKTKGTTAAVYAKLLRFTSSNKSIANVNAKGKVKAKKAGTCTIYVQTPNSLWKSCKITVK